MTRRVVLFAMFGVLVAAMLALPYRARAAEDAAETNTGSAATQRIVNERCPVMPEELAKAVHEITFRGVPVRFCCKKCKERFLSDPQPYLAQLPHVPPKPLGAEPQKKVEPSPQRDFSQVVREVEAKLEPWRPLLILCLVVLVLQWIASRTLRRRALRESDAAAQPSARSRTSRLLGLLARPTTLLLLLAGVIAGRTLGPRAVETLPPVTNSAVHAAAGKIQADLARQAVLQGPQFVALLEKTYYRGNDDRSPKLYQGGVYRTCEFHIRLQTQDGKPVQAGQNVAEQPLFIRVEIERSPNTLDGHFSDEELVKTFLISREVLPSLPRDGDKNIYPFVTLESGKRWAATCPIGQVVPTGTRHLQGIVLMCPTTFEGAPPDEVWSTAHYGIEYILRFEEGVVTPSSKLWMGATVFPSDYPDERLHEWLSSKPLPEVPDGFRHAGEFE